MVKKGKSKPTKTKKIAKSQPIKRTAKYRNNKKKLLKLVVLDSSLEIIAKQLNINIKTAVHWRNWILDDCGRLTDDRILELKKMFITKSLSILDTSKIQMLKILVEQDTKGKIGAVRAMNDTIKTESEILSKFGVIDPEKHQLEHFASEGIEIIMFGEKTTTDTNGEAIVHDKD